jgi:hypothetical protein
LPLSRAGRNRQAGPQKETVTVGPLAIINDTNLLNLVKKWGSAGPFGDTTPIM